jgi:hypothetical protein
MQSAWLEDPPGQDWGESNPSHLGALAATDKNAPPQPPNAPGETSTWNPAELRVYVVAILEPDHYDRTPK